MKYNVHILIEGVEKNQKTVKASYAVMTDISAIEQLIGEQNGTFRFHNAGSTGTTLGGAQLIVLANHAAINNALSPVTETIVPLDQSDAKAMEHAKSLNSSNK